MKKIALLSFIFSLMMYVMQAQTATPPRVQIVSKSDTLIPVAKGKKKNFIIKIKFQLNAPFDATAGTNLNKVNLSIQRASLSSVVQFVKPDNTKATTIDVEINQQDWPITGKQAEVTQLLQLEFDSQADVTNDEIGQIIITNHPASPHYLVVSNDAIPVSSKYKPNKPFWVEIGANFDLIDGIQPNSPFFGVFFHKHDIRPLWLGNTRLFGNKKVEILDNQAQNNIGMFAGVFGSKTISTNTTADFFQRSYFNNNSFLPGKPDSIRIYKDAGQYAVKRSVRNIGLFMSPQLRLTHKSANTDGLHLFFAPWIELQWQKVTQEIDFSNLVKIDSTVIHVSKIDSAVKSSNGLINDAKTETDIRSHYFGIGFPIFFRETAGDVNVHLFVNPVIGYSNQPTVTYFDELQKYSTKTATNVPSRAWNWFYAVQFRLNEEKYGISFSGEVRGLLKKDNPPFVTLLLSKKFDLAKFLEFTK